MDLELRRGIRWTYVVEMDELPYIWRRKGFRIVGVDISQTFFDDAKRKAKEHGVLDQVTFLEGDVRDLKQVMSSITQSFDMVVSAWSSLGYYSRDDDLRIFTQARELARDGAILFIVETTNSEAISLRFIPYGYVKLENIVILEKRTYDPITSQACATWRFYQKRENNFEFIDEVIHETHIYNLRELASLLNQAGWEGNRLLWKFINTSTNKPSNKSEYRDESWLDYGL